MPHTRAAPVTGAASDPELVADLGLQHSRYEGPTGIVGVLQDTCRREGIPAASLWAAVPHYVSLAPSPRAARALCDRLAQLLDVPIDTAELAEAEESYAEQVSEAVSTDEETAAYVAELEKRTDELDLEEHEDLPFGRRARRRADAFLRERDAENGDDTPRDQLVRRQRARRGSGARPRPRRPFRRCRACSPAPRRARRQRATARRRPARSRR